MARPDYRNREELLDLLFDVARKATPYGKQDDGFVAMYLLPTGPIHRILAALQQNGRHAPLPDAPAIHLCSTDLTEGGDDR